MALTHVSRYYCIEDSTDTSSLDYKHDRYRFEEYDLSDLFETPKKNTTPKVHRCKTCRKVFTKVSNLAHHRKTHTGTPGFAKEKKGFTALDFAKRFSDAKTSFDPNLITASQYEEILSKVSPHPTTYPGYINVKDTSMPFVKMGSRLAIADDAFQVEEVIGEGGFARVYSAVWETGPPAERDTVLKVEKTKSLMKCNSSLQVQMPANDWEWYCLNQVHSR